MPTYAPTLPTEGSLNLSAIGDIWTYAISMARDTVNFIASQPVLVVLVIAVPLIGLGVGLFSRIKNA